MRRERRNSSPLIEESACKPKAHTNHNLIGVNGVATFSHERDKRVRIAAVPLLIHEMDNKDY